MEVKLESLIEKIKKDGVEEAKRMAQEIIDEAKQKAAGIIEEANSRIEKKEKEAKVKIDSYKQNAESALKQAARDLTLALKEEIIKLFDQALKEKIAEGMEADFIKKLILKIADNLPVQKDKKLEVLVNAKDAQKLKSFLVAALKDKERSIEVKTSKTIEHGFRIGVKGESAYYDFSEEAITEALGEFLNPAISQMLNSHNG